MIEQMDRAGLERVAQSLMTWEPDEEAVAVRRVDEGLRAYYLPAGPAGERVPTCRQRARASGGRRFG